MTNLLNYAKIKFLNNKIYFHLIFDFFSSALLKLFSKTFIFVFLIKKMVKKNISDSFNYLVLNYNIQENFYENNKYIKF